MQHAPTNRIQIAVATKYDRLVKYLQHCQKDFEFTTQYQNTIRTPALIDLARVPLVLPNAQKIVIGDADESDLSTAFKRNTIAYIKTPFNYHDAALQVFAALERSTLIGNNATEPGKVLIELKPCADGAALIIGDREFFLHNPAEIKLAEILIAEKRSPLKRICRTLDRSAPWFYKVVDRWKQQGIPIQSRFRSGYVFDLSEV